MFCIPSSKKDRAGVTDYGIRSRIQLPSQFLRMLAGEGQFFIFFHSKSTSLSISPSTKTLATEPFICLLYLVELISNSISSIAALELWKILVLHGVLQRITEINIPLARYCTVEIEASDRRLHESLTNDMLEAPRSCDGSKLIINGS